ncbi:hypothetical protein ACFQ34_27690 [Pseudonocardia benzenivorans]|uniref:Uncharacterized protein n=1 Tax=Pseudonocardia benzenivorans TaxID=228005 RepID=A0ABW3VRW3_9PSEU|nr:hypothetical protein PSD17_24080 [Pseudonocardia sp. D17]
MGKVKKKCCRSKPKRCKNCPVVALRLRRLGADELTGMKLRKALERARVY